MVGTGLLLFIVRGAWSGAWLAFLGWFLLQAAAAEGRHGLLREALGDLRVADLMIRRPETVAADSSLADFMDEIAHVHHYTTYPSPTMAASSGCSRSPPSRACRDTPGRQLQYATACCHSPGRQL